MYKKVLIIFGVLVLLVLAYFIYQHFHKQKEIQNPYSDAQITSEIYQTENGFGYKIFIDGGLYIDQPTIPAVAGNKSFESESDAQAVANLAIEKIKHGIIPPIISVEELNSIIEIESR
jgi:hypothetical protein